MQKDLIVVGSGAGGLTASIVAARQGLNVLLVEKAEFIGGATSWSGGGVWAPNNPLARQAGVKDTKEAVRAYINATVPGVRANVLDAFIEAAPAMVEYLVSNTEVAFNVAPYALDAWLDAEGASREGRVLTPAVYDGRRLKEHFGMLRRPMEEFNAPYGMMIDNADVPYVTAPASSFKSIMHVGGMFVRHARDMALHGRGTRLTMGNALAARLLKSAIDSGVEIWRKAPMKDLVAQDGRVIAIDIEKDGAIVRIETKRGVVLATGGFSQSIEMRRQYIPNPEAHQSFSPDGVTGDGIQAALRVGAKLDSGNVQNASHTVLSIYRRPDGVERKWPHLFLDRPKPGFMIVNQKGERFGNEAALYFAEAMHAKNCIPAWLIGDDKALRKYGLGAVYPGGLRLSRLQRTGYVVTAPTLAQLAVKIGVDPQGLQTSAAKMAEFARSGIDSDFGKGASEIDLMLGDFTRKPNPCLGALDSPPFHAVKIIPGDATTTLGLLINEHAQVLDQNEKPIQGLYACGLDMNSLWRGAPPGNGSNITLALTFGYIAARTACGGNMPPPGV